MKKSTFIIAILVLITVGATAQSVSNIHFDKSGKVIDIYYDLDGSAANAYEVTLLCSQDAGKTWGLPLIKVNGDIGKGVHTGKSKRVTWDVLSELDKLEGDIAFKLEVSVPSANANPTIRQSGSDEKQQYSSGISYDLVGRIVRSLAKPSYNADVQGKVVVSIKVNRQGQVTYASAGAKGTTISELNIQQHAESAARKTVFTPDSDAPEEQRGTITYVFLKQM